MMAVSKNNQGSKEFLQLGGVLVATALTLGDGSVSLAQEVTPEFVQETIAKANKRDATAQYNLGVMYLQVNRIVAR